VLAALLLAPVAQVGLAAGAPEADKKSEKSEPINITSDRMESNAAGDVVTFTGNVVATQADGMLKAKLVRVFYKTVPAKAPGQEPRREIMRIEAEGDVMLVQGDKVGTGDRGIYSAADRTMVLIGNAKVRQDRDWITGPKVTYYLDEERSVVEGGPGQRVNSLIHSDDDEGARQAP
jgi:lipopolysaccharide export system protein LptA